MLQNDVSNDISANIFWYSSGINYLVILLSFLHSPVALLNHNSLTEEVNKGKEWNKPNCNLKKKLLSYILTDRLLHQIGRTPTLWLNN